MKKVKILTSLSIFLFLLMFFVGIKVSAASYDSNYMLVRSEEKKQYKMIHIQKTFVMLSIFIHTTR